MIELEHDHIDSDTDVSQRFNGHQQIRDGSDSLDAAHEYQAKQHGNRNAGVRRRETKSIIQ
ncbi:hypothetical protein D3C86_2087760 [compost metagenome]